MTDSTTLKITNFGFAAGRIGLALLFVPMLLGLGLLFALDEHGSLLIGSLFCLFSLPFVWLAVTTPISVHFDDKVTVKYLFYQREYALGDVSEFTRSTESTSRLTPETALLSLVPGNSRPWLYHRHYDVGVLRLKQGKTVRFGVTDEVARQIERSFVPSKG